MRLNSAAGLLIGLFVFNACGHDDRQTASAREVARPAASTPNSLDTGATTIPPASSSDTHLNIDAGGHEYFLLQAGSVVKVDAGKTVIGFSNGVLRQTVSVGAFSIMKYPATVKQYKECVAAGHCAEPNFSECPNSTLPATAMGGVETNAALCVGYENAVAFCGHVGGRLPTLPEWMRAARGPEVRKHAWGDARANCAQHPKSYDRSFFGARAPSSALSLDGCTAAEADALKVGQHPTGASPYQVEDILLASGELTSGQKDSIYGACRSKLGCVTLSQYAGAIGSVGAYRTVSTSAGSESGKQGERRLAPSVWAFRCVSGN